MTPSDREITDADREALTRRPAGRPVMYQNWRELLFLHWEVPADSLRRLLPPGLELDLFRGRAFVGLVPFTMEGIRPAGLPAVRGLSDFHETNVRLYARDEQGRLTGQHHPDEDCRLGEAQAAGDDVEPRPDGVADPLDEVLEHALHGVTDRGRDRCR